MGPEKQALDDSLKGVLQGKTEPGSKQTTKGNLIVAQGLTESPEKERGWIRQKGGHF